LDLHGKQSLDALEQFYALFWQGHTHAGFVGAERLGNDCQLDEIRLQAFPLPKIRPPHNRYRELATQVGDHVPLHQPDKSSSN
jgi:hypothetical protein